MTNNNYQKDSEYKIEIFNSFDEVAKYRTIWNNLVLSTETPSPFLIFEWFESWWQCFESKNKLPYIIFIWKENELIGIAPLILIKMRKFVFTIKKIEFISMMKYAYSALNLAGYLDFIIKQGHHRIVLNSILRHLKEIKKNWDYTRLHPILSNSSTIKILQEIKINYKLSTHIRRVFFNSKIVFDSDWESYLKKLSKDFLKKIYQREKKLNQFGKVELKNIITPENADQTYNELVQIDKISWKGTKGFPINDKRYNNFFQTLLKNFSCVDSLFIGLLKIDNKMIAYDFVIRFGKISIDLKTSYDPNYRQYGVGNIVSFYNIKKMYELGYKEFHLLWGNIKAKSVWRPEIEQYDEVFIFNNRLKSKIINFIYHKLLLYRIIRFINFKFLN